jgi:hypothetical protein
MKTAVEWLVDALNKEMGLISFVPNADEEYKKELFNIIQQAKEMENSQATEYAKWSLDIYELHARFFTFLEWIKDEPKDDEQ